MAAVKERGYKVGLDVSIVGFDDLEVSEEMDPPLSTVRVPGYKMGAMAAELLIGVIEGEVSQPQQYVLESNLIIHRSTCNPRDSLNTKTGNFLSLQPSGITNHKD